MTQAMQKTKQQTKSKKVNPLSKQMDGRTREQRIIERLFLRPYPLMVLERKLRNHTSVHNSSVAAK